MQPLFEITDHIPLDGLGWDKGSGAKVNLNLTRKWQTDWNAIFEDKQRDDELDSAYRQRVFTAQYRHVAPLIKFVTVRQGSNVWERTNPTAEDLREMDETIDERILDLLVTEIQERNATRLLQAKTPFRLSRESLLTRGKENENQAANGSHKPANVNANYQ